MPKNTSSHHILPTHNEGRGTLGTWAGLGQRAPKDAGELSQCSSGVAPAWHELRDGTVTFRVRGLLFLSSAGTKRSCEAAVGQLIRLEIRIIDQTIHLHVLLHSLDLIPTRLKTHDSSEIGIMISVSQKVSRVRAGESTIAGREARAYKIRRTVPRETEHAQFPASGSWQGPCPVLLSRRLYVSPDLYVYY